MCYNKSTNGNEGGEMVNKALLKSKMALNNDNNKTLSVKLQLSPSNFSSKLNSKNKFTDREKNFIRIEYNLTDTEFVEIFFL